MILLPPTLRYSRLLVGFRLPLVLYGVIVFLLSLLWIIVGGTPTRAAGETYSFVANRSQIEIRGGDLSQWNSRDLNHREGQTYSYLPKRGETIYEGTLTRMGQSNTGQFGNCTFTITIRLENPNSNRATITTSEMPHQTDSNGERKVVSNCEPYSSPRDLNLAQVITIEDAPPADRYGDENQSGRSASELITERWAQGDTFEITPDTLNTYTEEVIRRMCGETFNNADYKPYYNQGKFELCVSNALAAREAAVIAASENPTTCIITGVGWFVCTATMWLAEVVDGIYDFAVEPLLRTPPINMDIGSNDNGVYRVWSQMRNIANVLFVVMFMVIIYSQLSGTGISNYGIKKRLPRLIIAAVLVNVSFFLAAIAVDISNILGSGIHQLITNIRGNLGEIGVDNWSTIAAVLLSGGAVAAAATGAAGATVLVGVVAALVGGGSAISAIAITLASILIPFLLAAVIGVFIVLFILVARQVLIILLIVVSPLAFVALLLPNTEKYFTKWRQLLMTLLLFYPIIAFMFAGAQLVGVLMITAAGSTTSGDPASAIIPVIMLMSAHLAMVIPFFFLPMMIRKFGGANLDRIAGNIQARAKKATAPVDKLASQSRKFAGGVANRRFSQIKANGAANITGDGHLASIRRGLIGTTQSIGNQYDQRNSKNAMAERTYKEDAQQAMVDRLITDPAYALAAAGGDEARRDEIVSRARTEQDEHHMKSAQAEINDLSREQYMELALGRNITRADGTGVAASGHIRRAALKNIEGSLNADEGMQVARSVNTSTNSQVRKAASNAVKNSGASKVPWLGGGRLGYIEDGTYSAKQNDSIVEGMNKLTSESLISGGAHAVNQAAAAHRELINQGRAGDADKITNTLQRVYDNALASSDLKASVTTELSDALQNNFGIAPTPPPSGP